MPQMKEFAAFSISSLTDRFSPWTEGLLQWMQRRRRLVRVVIGSVAVLVLCMGTLSIYWMRQRQQGLGELRKGLLALSAGDFSGAVDFLEHATHSLATGKAQQLSLLYLGEAYAAEKQPEMARLAYEKILANSEGEPYLTQLALFKLGRAAEQQGDLTQARQWYEKASTINGPVKPDSLFSTAQVLEAANDLNSARLYYEKLLSQYPDFSLGEIVRQKVE